jgi:hypothetical protein
MATKEAEIHTLYGSETRKWQPWKHTCRVFIALQILPVPFVDGDVENNKWVKAVTCIGLQEKRNTSGTRVMIFQKPTSTASLWGTEAAPIGKNDFGCGLLPFMQRNNTRV